MSNPASEIVIRPIGGRIGAEIEGLALSADLPKALLEALEAALLKHKVVFLRNQHHLDDASQEAFEIGRAHV